MEHALCGAARAACIAVMLSQRGRALFAAAFYATSTKLMINTMAITEPENNSPWKSSSASKLPSYTRASSCAATLGAHKYRLRPLLRN
eukprot:6190389-Pleurochrysis_carterae.AAC.2